jgi:hypothetical protein
MIIAVAPASTTAGIVTSVASIFTAIVLLVTAVIGLYQIVHIKKQGKDTVDKLEIVHDLVNHLYTDALKSDLESTQMSYETMTDLIAERRKDGVDPSPETIAAQTATSVKIHRLTQELADRQTVVDAIIERHRVEATKRLWTSVNCLA